MRVGDLVGLLTLGLSTILHAGTTTVTWSNNAATLLCDSSGMPLSQNVATVNQDGVLVQLGYFSGSSAGGNFAGTWIPLTLGTTIGDSADLLGSGNGRVSFTTFYEDLKNLASIYVIGDPGHYDTTSSVTITSSQPPNGKVLAIRFFDTHDGLSGNYNSVSADTWLWKTPSDFGESISIDLAVSALEWEDSVNPFRTAIAVPESSVCFLAGCGMALIFVYQRRRIARLG